MAPGGSLLRIEFLTAEGYVHWKPDLQRESKLLLCDAQTLVGCF